MWTYVVVLAAMVPLPNVETIISDRLQQPLLAAPGRSWPQQAFGVLFRSRLPWTMRGSKVDRSTCPLGDLGTLVEGHPAGLRKAGTDGVRGPFTLLSLPRGMT